MNYRLFNLINSAAGRWAVVDDVMRFAAVYLVYLVFSIAGAVVLYALLRRRFRAVLGFGATLVLAFGLGQTLAHISRERRPFQDHPVHQLIPHAAGVGMPSDHATAAFAIAFGLLVFLSRPAGIALTPLAILIGLARVWTGVHYPGDILAAVLIAALSALFIYVVNRGPRQLESIQPADFRRADQPTTPTSSRLP
ncbi:phosphatase PAP2 family protein [Actinoplanes sp. NPDC051411]|uniref:phosphatase PAP2 family protein n=1 Tax=Actinoplanes sp. NPDC051411 TaxID=3155522 RepID=UPI00341BF0B0